MHNSRTCAMSCTKTVDMGVQIMVCHDGVDVVLVFARHPVVLTVTDCLKHSPGLVA